MSTAITLRAAKKPAKSKTTAKTAKAAWQPESCADCGAKYRADREGLSDKRAKIYLCKPCVKAAFGES